MTLHPASHSILIETNEVCASFGTICAFLAPWGKWGMFNSHSCVDFILCPSGSRIEIAFSVGFIFIAGAPGCKKCPVAPASAIAMFLGILIELCGAVNAIFGLFIFDVTIVLSSSSSLISYCLLFFKVEYGLSVSKHLFTLHLYVAAPNRQVPKGFCGAPHCAFPMFCDRIHPFPTPVPSASALCWPFMQAPWHSCARSRGIFGM